jgi:hypothetical protein
MPIADFYSNQELKLFGLIRAEIESGMASSRPVRDEAARCNLFYEMENHLAIERRPAESDDDFRQRTKRVCFITRRIVDALCEHLYNPGPSRRIADDPDCDEWLQGVYEDNHADSLWQEADRYACLNGVAAFQFAATGKPEKPITVHLWDRADFEVWSIPGEPLAPFAVCVISKYDESTTYDLWTRIDHWTFQTEQAGSQMTVGRVAVLISKEQHEYGVLPFSFVHDRTPCKSLATRGIGPAVSRANAGLDQELSDVLESIKYYMRPIGFSRGVNEKWRPKFAPGSFNEIPGRDKLADNRMPPEVFYLQADLDIANCWVDLSNYKDETIEEMGVPLSAVRMQQSNTASGEALEAEQYPLVRRTKARQRPFTRYERDFAKVALAVGGAYYGRPDLDTCSEDVHMTLVWPEPRITTPGKDRDDEDQTELAMGLTSQIEILMRRRGITRIQAIEQLEQLAKDRIEYERITGGPEPVEPETDPATTPPDAKVKVDNEP